MVGEFPKRRVSCAREADDEDAGSTSRDAARREAQAQVESIEGSGYYCLHSVLLLGSRLLTRALNWYTGLLHLAPKDKAKIYRALSLHHRHRDELQKALVFLKEWSRNERGNPEPVFQMGEVLASLGEHRAALAAFDRVLAMRGGHIPALTRKCALLLRLKNYSAAIAGLELLAREQPDQAKHFYRLGLAYDGEGRLEDAITAMRKAVDLDPEEVKYHHHLGFMSVRKEDHSSAAEHFGKALELAKDETHLCDE